MNTRQTMVLGTANDPCAWLVNFHNTTGPVWEGSVINGGYRILFDHKLGETRLYGQQGGAPLCTGVLITDHNPPNGEHYNDRLHRCHVSLAKRHPLQQLSQRVWFACAPVVRRARALRYAFVAAGTAFALAYRDPDKVAPVEPDFDDTVPY